MLNKKRIKVGVGFATGRKHFHRVLRSYLYSFKESGLVDNENLSLNLFIAYDLGYNNTKKSDYTAMSPDLESLIDSRFYIGRREVEETKELLTECGALDFSEASAIFGNGYAAQRNIILYYALKSDIDYLLFLDDDEYPMAVTHNRETAIWSGQHVLARHLQNIKSADYTYGYHCGYISPIPAVDFNGPLKQDDFRLFIEAISNDIVNWETIKKVMQDGGVTYADTNVLANGEIYEVQETNKAKFISGSNLCINLTDLRKVLPFYNPPGARGEDTFLSTCLLDRKVLRVPCYAFHDGFSTYNHLLSGVLPVNLKSVRPDSDFIRNRFYKACVGWVRYKPLLLYITNRETFDGAMKQMTENLNKTLPAVCKYFNSNDFMNILTELKTYENSVEDHYNEFTKVRETWSKLMAYLENEAR